MNPFLFLFMIIRYNDKEILNTDNFLIAFVGFTVYTNTDQCCYLIGFLSSISVSVALGVFCTYFSVYVVVTLQKELYLYLFLSGH